MKTSGKKKNSFVALRMIIVNAWNKNQLLWELFGRLGKREIAAGRVVRRSDPTKGVDRFCQNVVIRKKMAKLRVKASGPVGFNQPETLNIFARIQWKQ